MAARIYEAMSSLASVFNVVSHQGIDPRLRQLNGAGNMVPIECPRLRLEFEPSQVGYGADGLQLVANAQGHRVKRGAGYGRSLRLMELATIGDLMLPASRCHQGAGPCWEEYTGSSIAGLPSVAVCEMLRCAEMIRKSRDADYNAQCWVMSPLRLFYTIVEKEVMREVGQGHIIIIIIIKALFAPHSIQV
ncbi:hypothetical protein AC579_8067 [Pseudocercospora musae]|uniref:Uncharacterized protein n=1 Tax=Pseudocercospora musae TaxID=113226 RepID=A0A139HS16_9PEZI|nr:hypothetical protein AC579_8067 [Pseudocercospora musae]